MAEFKEIAKINKRICDKCNRMCITNKCPLSSTQNGRGICCDKLIKEYPEEYERICLEWAKENPEITNADKLYQIVKDAFGEEMASSIKDSTIGFCTYIVCPREDIDCCDCEYKGFWDKTYIEPKGEE